MPGNSARRGARRTAGSKKGQVVGSGGQGKRGLRGRGPTPRAEQRTGHPAARRAAAAGRRDDAAAGAVGQRRGGAGEQPAQRGQAARGRVAPRTPPPVRGHRGQGGRAGRGEGSETVAGRNPVVEALRAGVPATALYLAQRIDADDRVRDAVKLAADAGVPLLEVARPELDRIAGGTPHQGLALQVPPYSYADPRDPVTRAEDAAQAPLVVALDGVTDPRNLGAVVRSVAAFGGHGVVVPERRAAGLTAAAWRTSAGAAARVPVARVTNLTRALEDYQRAGLFVVGLDAAGEADLDDLELAVEPLVVVVGSEGRGLSRLVAQTCDMVVRIPMAAGTESLNAGVAAGVALYEVARRRRAG